MKEQLEQKISQTVSELLGADTTVVLTRPDVQFGDYTTNVALQAAKQAGKPPRAIAEELKAALEETLSEYISDVSIAGPGFINFRLSDDALKSEVAQMLSAPETYGKSDRFSGQTIVAEYSGSATS